MEEKLNYKMAMAEIESIVSKLEDNKLDIDELKQIVKDQNLLEIIEKMEEEDDQ